MTEKATKLFDLPMQGANNIENENGKITLYILALDNIKNTNAKTKNKTPKRNLLFIFSP